MIARLRGLVVDRGLDHVVLDVNGVGYLVHGPAPMVRDLPPDEPVVLQVCTIVREDAITLFGFADAASREAFETLRQVTGVGPKLALAVLSTLSPALLHRAVEADDANTLVKVPGVGKKLAQRLCLELKGKLSPGFGAALAAVPAPRPVKPADPLALALTQLDYRKTDIDRALADASVPGPEDGSLEDRLRAALRALSGGR